MTAVPRVLAIALLLVLAGNTALPAFFSDPESTLPSCCRRDGKHHCAMMAMIEMVEQDEDAGPSWKAVQQKCAQFPKSFVGVHSVPSAPPRPNVAGDLTVSHPATKAQPETLYRISQSRTRQKRGPPSLV